LTVQLHELELAVGDVVQIGDYTVTVMDIENGEVTFRVEEPQVFGGLNCGEMNNGVGAQRPR
jgi:hypothetical protein